ncbi:MAG: exosome complex RNA-binding protein Csl4 [Candidatus Diapherotrites archaeon]|nr:exosome complex RNA-binding protein Csl4 [Candidatus Diapherotrites archaeon]
MADIVFPGDFIAEEEEFLPGKGAFVSDGKVLASNIGSVDIDYNKRVVRVKGKMQTSTLMHRGLIVVGIVNLVRDSVAFVSLVPKETEEVRYVPPPDTQTVIHVSHVKRGYVNSMRDELRAGDIIRAKILEENKQTISLTLDGKHLGVIKAYCSKCKNPLRLEGKELICDVCGSKEERKIADDYGSGKLY